MDATVAIIFWERLARPVEVLGPGSWSPGALAMAGGPGGPWIHTDTDGSMEVQIEVLVNGTDPI